MMNFRWLLRGWSQWFGRFLSFLPISGTIIAVSSWHSIGKSVIRSSAMGNSITYGYGTVDQVNQVYQKLPSTAKEAKELMEQVGSDGKVRMPNGEYVDLPIFFQAAWLKFGMAFAATTLAYHAGYPGVSFNAILQTFLTTDTMVNILSNIVSQDNIKLADIDADAYAKRLFVPWTANPKIFAEAQFSQYLNTQSAASYQDLINNLTYAGLSDSGDLRNPFKGKSPPLNIALLLMLAETGQIGLVLMVIYKQQMKMSNALSMKMVALLGRHNKM